MKELQIMSKHESSTLTHMASAGGPANLSEGLHIPHPATQVSTSGARGVGGGGAPGSQLPNGAPQVADVQVTGMRHGNFSRRRQNHAIYDHKKDSFIEWVRGILRTSFDLDTMDTSIPILLQQVEELVREHIERHEDSRLARIVPDVATFFTPLKLRDAFLIYNKKYRITRRRFVYPTFNEIRHVVNLAQVLGLPTLKLMTFDGDQTLYPDQKNLEDLFLAQQLLQLLQAGVKIALVTAANYGLNGEKYETRLRVLLEYFSAKNLSREYVENFYIVAGESSYLLKIGPDYRIHPAQEQWPIKNERSSLTTSSSSSVAAARMVPSNITQKKVIPEQVGVFPVEEQKLVEDGEDSANNRGSTNSNSSAAQLDNMRHVLDACEATLRQGIYDLNMKAQILRKATSVGCIQAHFKEPGRENHYFRREQLDELVYRLQETLIENRERIHFPYCAFNGGNDVWFDIGNKKEGIQGLQTLLGVEPCQCLHVGDQMARTGNDFMARFISPVCWIVDPSETKKILKHVLRKLGITSHHRSTSADNIAPVGSQQHLLLSRDVSNASQSAMLGTTAAGSATPGMNNLVAAGGTSGNNFYAQQANGPPSSAGSSKNNLAATSYSTQQNYGPAGGATWSTSKRSSKGSNSPQTAWGPSPISIVQGQQHGGGGNLDRDRSRSSSPKFQAGAPPPRLSKLSSVGSKDGPLSTTSMAGRTIETQFELPSHVTGIPTSPEHPSRQSQEIRSSVSRLLDATATEAEIAKAKETMIRWSPSQDSSEGSSTPECTPRNDEEDTAFFEHNEQGTAFYTRSGTGTTGAQQTGERNFYAGADGDPAKLSLVVQDAAQDPLDEGINEMTTQWQRRERAMREKSGNT
ncbi:unnamed protein product [Amoebophrya sp. A120]|nr:unnamed protein product [Amoebophrya sp. A120]|eukprot:GSA120T00025748001.1